MNKPYKDMLKEVKNVKYAGRLYSKEVGRIIPVYKMTREAKVQPRTPLGGVTQ